MSGTPGWNGADLSGQHALREPPVARPQHGPAIGAELRRNTKSWRPQVPRIQVPQAADDVVGFAPFGIDRAKVLTDGTAVIEPHSRVDRQPVADGEGVSQKCGSRNGQPTFVGRTARDHLRRLTIEVDEPLAGRNDRGSVVLAALQLPAHLPLVIGAGQSGAIVADRRLRSGAYDRDAAKRLGSSADDTRPPLEAARCRPIPITWILVLVEDESPDAHIPQRIGSTTYA